MVRYGEHFFTSLGFAPLPQTFWERSLFVKPRDRDVVCHASAWDVDAVDDLRLKMCIEITAEDFTTIHHELGHNFYQRAYNKQPFLFRDSANDGFHEAMGDTIALSVTPEYLVKLGLLERAPDPSKDIGLLLTKALEKIAFLPFGLVIDQWRWKVFSGEIPPEKYNQTWWELRRKYQGIAPPVARSESRFRSGREVSRRGERAVHAAISWPIILQFQFHRALAQIGGLQGAAQPLFDLRQQGGRQAPERHAGDGREPSVAGGAVGPDRTAGDGRDGDSRLLRAAAEVAGRTERGQADRVVTRAPGRAGPCRSAILHRQQSVFL